MAPLLASLLLVSLGALIVLALTVSRLRRRLETARRVLGRHQWQIEQLESRLSWLEEGPIEPLAPPEHSRSA